MNRIQRDPSKWSENIEELSSSEKIYSHAESGESSEDSLIQFIDPFQKLDRITSFFNIDLSSFWNDSVKELYTTWHNLYENNTPSFTINGKSTAITSIEQGDAGFDFNNQYVFPKTLGDDYTYSPDYHYAVQQDDNLSYTNNPSLREVQQSSEIIGNHYYYRLIMPKNSRRVEAEDLSRNFWVISKVLTGLCGFLFTTESPLVKLLNGLTTELAELWQNVLFLWLAFKITQEKQLDKNIHIELVPVDGESLQVREFNVFLSGNYDISSDSRYEDYLYKYPESDLLLIPYSRSGGFYQNYHTTLVIHGIIGYFRRYQEPKAKDGGYSWNDHNKIIKSFSPALKIDIRDFAEKIVGIREKDQILTMGAPFSDVNNLEEDDPGVYYGQLRVVPDIKISDLDNSVFTLILSFYDIGKFYITGATDLQDAFIFSLSIPINTLGEISEIKAIINETEIPEIVRDDENISQLYLDAIESFSGITYPFINYPRYFYGAYKGETLTTTINSKQAIHYSDLKKISLPLNGQLIKIGNFLPTTDAEGNIDINGTFVNGSKIKDVTSPPISSLQYNPTSNQVGVREQKTSEGENTSYLLNLTWGTKVTGAQALTRPAVSGVGCSFSPSSCSLYIPYRDETGNFTYNIPVNETKKDYILASDEVKKDKLEIVGKQVIEEYIKYDAKNGFTTFVPKYNEEEEVDQMFLLFGAIGICPWVGGNSNGPQGLQFYWTQSILTHLYVYIKTSMDGLEDFGDKIIYNNKCIGYLKKMAYLNRTEENFPQSVDVSDNNEQYIFLSLKNGGRWRLPSVQVNGEKVLIYSFKETVGQETETKYILTETDLSSYTQEEYSNYIKEHPDECGDLAVLYKTALEKFISGDMTGLGLWTVYDGNKDTLPSGTTTWNNKQPYSGVNTYKQVISAPFSITDETPIFDNKLSYRVNGTPVFDGVNQITNTNGTYWFNTDRMKKVQYNKSSSGTGQYEVTLDKLKKLLWSERAVVPTSGWPITATKWE